MASEHASVSDLQKFRADVYKYVQSSIQQITSAYGPKFKLIQSFMDQTENSLKTIGDYKTHEDLAFEEFKNNITLKTKMTQESVSSHATKLLTIETRVKD